MKRSLVERRVAAAYFSSEPTMTDQSAAATTDLNVIVNTFLKTGQSQSKGRGAYGDFTTLPTDLRGMIETSRSINKWRAKLPAPLKGKSVQELLALTPDALKQILTPAPKPEDKKDEIK